MTTQKTRRIFGIVTLSLCALSIFCLWFLGNSTHLIFQLDILLYFITFIIVVIYALIMLVYGVRSLHWALKLPLIILPIGLFMYITYITASMGLLTPDSKVWSDNQYVVYHENNYWIDPGKFVLYKRDIIMELPCCTLGSEFFDPDKIEYFIDEDKNLIREEADWSFDGRSWHTTLYYNFRAESMFAYEQKPDYQPLFSSLEYNENGIAFINDLSILINSIGRYDFSENAPVYAGKYAGTAIEFDYQGEHFYIPLDENLLLEEINTLPDSAIVSIKIWRDYNHHEKPFALISSLQLSHKNTDIW